MTTYDRTRALPIIRARGLANGAAIYDSAQSAGLGLPAACALMEKESSGRNVYGHDAGGALSGYPAAVDESNFAVFLWLVNSGTPSNGVGPCQLTYPGFFDQMAAEGLKPWVAGDNMLFGFRLLQGYFAAARKAGSKQPWVDAGTRYNGSAIYGHDLAVRITSWSDTLAGAAS
jgi:hypothetical protein